MQAATQEAEGNVAGESVTSDGAPHREEDFDEDGDGQEGDDFEETEVLRVNKTENHKDVVSGKVWNAVDFVVIVNMWAEGATKIIVRQDAVGDRGSQWVRHMFPAIKAEDASDIDTKSSLE